MSVSLLQRAVFGGLMVTALCCTHTLEHTFRATYKDMNTMIHTANPAPEYLKVHTKNGDVFVFISGWNLDSTSNQLLGVASRFDFNRLFVDSGQVRISTDQIAIIETNRPIESLDASITATLTSLTIINAAVTIACIANPKACFGSCPTFYSGSAANVHYADAEGFSSSVAPSLEAADTDPLQHPPMAAPNGRLRLTMKNEAFETHVVNSVALLAVPCQAGEQIVQGADQQFYAVTNITPPSHAATENPERNATWLLGQFDGNERTSTTDGNNLQSREVLTLRFPAPAPAPAQGFAGAGVVIGFRQSLLSTFLFYTALSWMGHSVSDVFASIESAPSLRRAFCGTEDLLGGIDCFVWNKASQRWDSVGSLKESGPLARNLLLLPIPTDAATGDSLQVQLRMTRGHWRLDCAMLASIVGTRPPSLLRPVEVQRNSKPDTAAPRQLGHDDQQYLVSLPGDQFSLIFPQPPSGGNAQFFVRSKGYYLEWMRPAWNNPPQLDKLMGMVANNPTVWRDLAVEFKGMEAGMEEVFWSSKAIK
ncbi:MAG: hypothetical protein IT211_08490 [Armatimonadetes bacterium]|nr:hypothetical protein [Armatimonadota bacterium]